MPFLNLTSRLAASPAPQGARLLVIFGMLGVFVTDMFTPLGFAHSILYLPLLFAAMLARNRRFVLALGLLAVAFTLAGYFVSPPAPPGVATNVVLANRTVALLVIVAVTLAALMQIELVNRLHTANLTLARARQELESSEKLMRMAGHVASFGGWRVELAGQRVVWSDEVARIHAMPPGHAPHLDNAIAFYAPEYRPRIAALFADCAERGLPFDEELEIIDAKGLRHWVRATGAAERASDGSIAQVVGAFQDISARKRGEVALQESRHRFVQLADAMPMIVWTADAAGRIDFISEAMAIYSGVPVPALLQGGWLELMPDADRARSAPLWHAALRAGTPHEIEVQLRRRDGSLRWHLVRALPIRGAAAEVERWFGSATDIDDQKILQQDTQRLAQRLSSTFESITEGLATLDREGRFTYLNGEAETLLQRHRADLIGRDMWAEFPAAHGTAFADHYRQAVASASTVVFEDYYAPLKAWFEVRLYPSDEGMTVYFRDISRHREQDARLLLLETSIERLNDIVMITEAEPLSEPGPRIVYVNDAFERRTGYTRAEVIGKTPRILQGEKTEIAALARIRASLEKWQPVRAELLNYTKAGEPFWLELDIVPVADAKGWFTHWIAVERDITERVNMQTQLARSQRLESVGQLTGGVAHDFNNLLAVILGNADLLSEELQDQPGLSPLAQMIGSAAQRGAELTQRLLAFAGRQPLEPQVVDANRLVGDMDGLLRRTLGEHVEIEMARGAGLWPATVDPAQLESALLNLCINARDAMPDGGRLTIETANARLDQDYADGHLDVTPGQYVLLAVSDTGSGIAPEHLQRVFEPFYTTKAAGKGTGLGLSMVYGFIKQSHGHVSIYSEPGSGTTVRMYLPRAQASVAADTARAPRRAAPAEGGSETILLVEDDELVRRYAVGQLAALGYRVIEAAHGAAALEILQTRSDIELLFTDVVMPGGISGRQLADAARALHPGLKVLYTSGYTENAIVHHGRLDPGVRLLQKPYRRAELARQVRSAITAPA